MMIAKNKSRLVVVVLAISMLLQAFGSVAIYAAPGVISQQKIDNSRTAHSLDAMAEIMVSTTYEEYLALNEEIPDATVTLDRIMAADEVNRYVPEAVDEESAEKLKDYAKVDVFTDEETGTDVLYTPGEGRVSFKVTVPETAMYTVKIKYKPIVDGWDEERLDDDGHGSNIERILLVDDLAVQTHFAQTAFDRRLCKIQLGHIYMINAFVIDFRIGSFGSGADHLMILLGRSRISGILNHAAQTHHGPGHIIFFQQFNAHSGILIINGALFNATQAATQHPEAQADHRFAFRKNG